MRAIHVRGVSQLAGFERFSFGAGCLGLCVLAHGGFGVPRLAGFERFSFSASRLGLCALALGGFRCALGDLDGNGGRTGRRRLAAANEPAGAFAGTSASAFRRLARAGED
jgi:hypothetical protein